MKCILWDHEWNTHAHEHWTNTNTHTPVKMVICVLCESNTVSGSYKAGYGGAVLNLVNTGYLSQLMDKLFELGIFLKHGKYS